jgi:anthranilate 1,2-dioxygenase small subunit
MMDRIDTVGTADTHLLRHRIEQLQLDYVHALDKGELDRWPGFFTERCLYAIVARDNMERGQELGVMRFESRAMLVDRVNATQHAAVFAPRTLCHVLSGTSIEAVDADGIRSRTNVAIYQTSPDGDTLLLMAANYRDKTVEIDGKLLFKEKRVIYDTLRLPDSVVNPL